MTFNGKIKLIIRGYKTIHNLVPGYLLSMTIQAIADSLLPFINIYMSAKIIIYLADKRELPQVLILVLMTIAFNLIITLILNGMQRLSNYYSSKFWQVEDEPLNEKIRAMDYERIEDVNIHLVREKIRVLKSANGLGLSRLTWSFKDLIQNVCKVIFSASLISGSFTTYSTVAIGNWSFLFKPWFALIIIVCIIASVFMEIYRVSALTKKQSAVVEGFLPLNRIATYYHSYLSNYKAGKDLKLYGLSESIYSEFEHISSETVSIMNKHKKITDKYDILGSIMAVTLTGIIYAYVALKSLFGSFSAGNIVKYIGSLSQFGSGLSGIMHNMTMLMVNTEALSLFFEFIDMPDIKYRGTLTTEKRLDNDYEIEFHNVSFKYPGTDVYALKNLNLKFNIGQRMAVVGMNGSGKTTMIKLLCRLYDPIEGEITLNGIDIKKYDYKEYMEIFSVVFQDFKLFSFSIGQNIAADINFNSQKANDCLKKSGFSERISSMPKGLDTPLYKDFEEDGVEISGGEAQKIALARALYKDASFVILDEPTAALDPIAEFEVYSKFNEIVGGKTAVYISHRLSSCRFCDDIVVFHEGEMVQRGSHDDLLEDVKGKYYELWNAQAQYYKSDVC